MTCTLCDKPVRARGWCANHYERWQRHGDPLGGRPTHEDNEARFRALWVEAPNGCHIWQGAPNGGYGRFYAQGKRWKAHVWAWVQANGPVPDGLVLDHFHCDTPLCVNPEHLWPSTNRENVLRGRGPSALNAAKTECKRGHPFTPENTYYNPALKGARVCRTCQAAALKAWKAAHRVTRH